jgi:hypothetical protein
VELQRKKVQTYPESNVPLAKIAATDAQSAVPWITSAIPFSVSLASWPATTIPSTLHAAR